MSQDTADIETIADDGNRCGEGPIWDPRRRRLLWTDIAGAVTYEFRPASGQKNVLSRGVSVSAIALAQAGRLLFGSAAGLGLWSVEDGYRPILAVHQGETLAINDLIAAPSGGVYFGTVYWTSRMEKWGRLYFLDAGGGVRVVDEGIELANGLGFSPDNQTLYFVDSASRRIYAYDVHPRTGDLARKRTLATFASEDGLPDGLTVDAEGYLWCALWYGGQVVRLDPDGKLQRRVKVPALQTSSVAFGGDELDELYVTSAAEPWTSALAPAGYSAAAPGQGGALYRLRPGVRGKAEHVAECPPRGLP